MITSHTVRIAVTDNGDQSWYPGWKARVQEFLHRRGVHSARFSLFDCQQTSWIYDCQFLIS